MLFSLLLPPYISCFLYSKKKKLSLKEMLSLYPIFVWIINMILLIVFRIFIGNHNQLFNEDVFNLGFIVNYNLCSIIISLLLPSLIIYIMDNYKFELQFIRKVKEVKNGKNGKNKKKKKNK